MITDIPTSEDFFNQASLFLNYAWTFILDVCLDFGYARGWVTPNQLELNEFWLAAEQPLRMSQALAQQGAELVLKGLIAQESAYLLIANNPQLWPKGCDRQDTEFSSFRTLDSQDLVRVHNTVCNNRLSASYSQTFETYRKTRNAILHTVNRSQVDEKESIIQYIIETAHLAKPQEWGLLRRKFLEERPIAQVMASGAGIRLWEEMAYMTDLLGRGFLQDQFGFDKSARSYICPHCYNAGDGDWYNSRPTSAYLLLKERRCDRVRCFVCRRETPVRREKCAGNCPGNVISELWERECLTCYLAHED